MIWKRAPRVAPVFCAALALLSLISPGCRRAPESPFVSDGPGRPVIFLGLDGADWQLLDGYIAAGRMPNLARLVKEGQPGVLATIQLPLSPLVWTTMMTGVSPLEHGILDFTRFNPRTGEREPITREERRVPAVWNMASAQGRGVAVFGLWATWPAEPVRGLMVADRFSSFTSRDAQPPPGIVHPQDREAWARAALRRAEEETGLKALWEYLPWLDEEGYRRALERPDPYADPVSALRRILVETRVYDELARSWIARQKPDLAIVYFQGTDTIGHVFAPFAPPRQPSVAPEDFVRYNLVPEIYFSSIDRMIGEYRKLAKKNGAVLMIASDHGFLWNEGRPERLSSAAAATAGRWHRDEGIYLLWGSGIAPGAERGRGRIDQVCATLLALLGLPPGQGLAGPPLPGSPELRGETVDYRRQYRPAPAVADAAPPNSEEIEKLRALGYVGSSERSRALQGSRSTRTAASYNNEGLLLREAGRTAEAAAAFERAIALDPGHASALFNLSELLHREGREPDRSDELLLRSLAAGLPEGADHAARRAADFIRAGRADRGLRLLEGAVASLPAEPRLHLTRGRYRLERQECRAALADFEEAARLGPSLPLAHASVGLARLCLGDPERAA
ncbi:MAG TPA: alkaline phosphatase family protein, partial [Thermoanaerobaculia bacterium]